MKVPLLSFLSLTLFFSNAFSQSVDYPLHLGDRWEYHTLPYPGSGSTTGRVRIAKDTLMPNGRTYAEFQGDLFYGRRFQRQVGDSVFLYLPSRQTEALLFDFTRSPGDTVSLFPSPFDNDTTLVQLLSRNSEGTPKNNSRSWTFLIDNLIHGVDDEEYLIISDSIGVTQISCFCDPMYLTGAIIDGKQYGTITQVINDRDVPSSFLLHQNYPNPFNPFTTISYELPERSLVVLKVFNILGQEICTLVSDIQDAGEKIVRFDALNMPSGVYVYRMTVTTAHQTISQSRSMLVLK